MKETVTSLSELALQWLARYEWLLWGLSVLSALMLVISAMVIPALIVRLPHDFYSAERSGLVETGRDRGSRLRRCVIVAIRNVVACILLLAGIAMLFLPGQGLLTILAALAVGDFPGKREIELRLLRLPGILTGVNWIRKRAGKRLFDLR